eukprot:TRINITY_DN1491_c3_g1_i1.p1 TRINITY_DN1491_c3_g1~~TRINITY_DN1491_c3_g1_i1.p1  ORF type:complete len:227 (+),score=48.75 TRINITY_DN1491_c3_g1_i1:60-740(+)
MVKGVISKGGYKALQPSALKSAMKKTAAKELKKASKKKSKAAATTTTTKGKGPSKNKHEGVIYLGHIPHGYYEGQIRSFLSQYGKIRRLRLSRCKKSGKSKGYGFVQFDDPEVAPAVAEEVNGMHVSGKTLRCDTMEEAKVHKNMWKAMKIKTLQKKDADIRINGFQAHYKKACDTPVPQRIMNLVTKERQHNRKINSKGIEYTFTGFEDQLKALGLEYVPKAKKG